MNLQYCIKVNSKLEWEAVLTALMSCGLKWYDNRNLSLKEISKIHYENYSSYISFDPELFAIGCGSMIARYKHYLSFGEALSLINKKLAVKEPVEFVLNKNHTAIISEKCVTVGCQKFSHEVIRDLVKELDSFMNKSN